MLHRHHRRTVIDRVIRQLPAPVGGVVLAGLLVLAYSLAAFVAG